LMAEGLSRLQMRRWKKLSLRTENGFLVSDSQSIRGVGALVDVFPQDPGDAEGHVRWCGCCILRSAPIVLRSRSRWQPEQGR
jgi:hypothetical protein